MGVLEQGLADQAKSGAPITDIADKLVNRYRDAKKRMPGLGHRIHTDDPRTMKLFDLAKGLGLAGNGVVLISAIKTSFQNQGKSLPINVDGAIAALLIDLEVPPALANAFFIISRVPGLVAHYHEEIERERPMRRIHPTQHEYDGPGDRNI